MELLVFCAGLCISLACFYLGYRFKSMDIKADQEIEQLYKNAFMDLSKRYNAHMEEHAQVLHDAANRTEILNKRIERLQAPRIKMPTLNNN